MIDKQSSEVAGRVIINIYKKALTHFGTRTIREKGNCYADWNTGQAKCH